MQKLCDYGCQNYSNFILKNGKHCCSKHYNSCPELKRKNSESLKKRYQENPNFGFCINYINSGKLGNIARHNLPEEIKKEIYKKQSETLKNTLKNKPIIIDENTIERELKRRSKISETSKKNKKSGGFRYNSGKCKGIWYESKIAGKVFLRGSYEIFYAKYLDYNNIKWEQNLKPFNYIWNDNEHKYYPDFYLVESDEYIETKGYKTDKDLAKWKYFPHKLTVLMLNDLKKLGY